MKRRNPPLNRPQTHEALKALTRARAQYAVLHAETYCRNSDCPVREVEIRFKDEFDSLLELVKESGLRCPLCGTTLTLHHAMSRGEKDEADSSAARASVNLQMYERDHGGGTITDDIVAVPGNVMNDTRLPPTPPNWWSEAAEGKQ